MAGDTKRRVPNYIGGIYMAILVLSDIHGNLAALQAVLKDAAEIDDIQSCILLGDVIDYGMHSNEVIELLQALPYPVICNIWGNHEQAVCQGEYERFSSERGRVSAMHTKERLSDNAWKYINDSMEHEGYLEFVCEGKRCLAVHGNYKERFWKSIDITGDLQPYQAFDYVFSGHSHLPHFYEKFYTVDDAKMRNKKKTIFVNPGSVGQPRNHNPMAQYAVIDLAAEIVLMKKTRYDIIKEQSAFTDQVDEFYKKRLELGI